MIVITTWDQLRCAIATGPSTGTASILGAHAGRLDGFVDQPLAELCEILIIEPPDRLADLEARLSMSLHLPPWEYVDRVDGWFELVIVTGQDGFGHVVLIPDQPDTDPDLLAICRAHSS